MSRSNCLNLIACILLVGSLSMSEAARSATHDIVNLGELAAAALGVDEPFFGHAYDINEAGQIVGDWADNAFFYDPVTGINVRPFFPATVGNSYFSGLNNLGLAVGLATGNIMGKVVYDYNTNTYMGVGERISLYPDIDDSGAIIERSRTEMLAEYTGPTDLFALLPTNPGWDSLTPVAMNSSGQIVGWGKLTVPLTSFNIYPFLMTPIPIPPAVYLFGSGLLGLAGIAKRGKS